MAKAHHPIHTEPAAGARVVVAFEI